MSELSFEQMLEDSVKTIRNGEIVQGTVIDVKEDEIILNIGYKADGIITKSEYSNDASLVLTDAVHVGDSMEAKVIKQIFDKSEKKVCVSSTKSMIGHCLAAAGSLELAATLLSIKNSTCMPTINLTSPMEECSSNNFITTGKKMSIRYAISNSFAFAGNTASILIGDDKHSYRE